MLDIRVVTPDFSSVISRVPAEIDRRAGSPQFLARAAVVIVGSGQTPHVGSFKDQILRGGSYSGTTFFAWPKAHPMGGNASGKARGGGFLEKLQYKATNPPMIRSDHGSGEPGGSRSRGHRTFMQFWTENVVPTFHGGVFRALPSFASEEGRRFSIYQGPRKRVSSHPVTGKQYDALLATYGLVFSSPAVFSWETRPITANQHMANGIARLYGEILKAVLSEQFASRSARARAQQRDIIGRFSGGFR